MSSGGGLVSSFTLQEGLMRHVCTVKPRGKLPGICKHFFKPVSRAESVVVAASTANLGSCTSIWHPSLSLRKHFCIAFNPLFGHKSLYRDHPPFWWLFLHSYQSTLTSWDWMIVFRSRHLNFILMQCSYWSCTSSGKSLWWCADVGLVLFRFLPGSGLLVTCES